MKKVLSLLVSFVVLQTQSWALSGGPVFNGDLTSFTGVYAGVLIPQNNFATATDLNGVAPSASIGLFSLSQPTTGFATGTLVAFVNGAVFNGTIQGIIDPDGGKLDGIIDAVSAFQATRLVPVEVPATATTPATTTLESEDFDIVAEGTLKAKIVKGRTDSDASRIEGTASLDIFSEVTDGTPVITQTAIFEVDGFKQANATAVSL